MAVKDVLDLVKKNKVEIVDFKFIDVPGLWQHFSIPAVELTADLFEDGIGFDGLEHPGVSVDQRVRYATDPRPRQRYDGPIHRAPDVELDL